MKHLFLLVVAVLFMACNDNSKYSKIPSKKVEKVQTSSAVVNEVIDAGGYTYINGTTGNQEVWMAIPQTKIEVGQTIYFQGGMEMENFESKELNRTFERILFVEGVSLNEQPAPNVKNPHEGVVKQEKKQERPPLPQLELPDDVISIEDIYTKQSDFEGKSLNVYGVVWKVNNGILDRNWVHIEDGTFTSAKSSLTITTQEMVKIGDTIKLKGKLTLNKDFGYGYVYDVLLEEGTLLE